MQRYGLGNLCAAVRGRARTAQQPRNWFIWISVLFWEAKQTNKHLILLLREILSQGCTIIVLIFAKQFDTFDRCSRKTGSDGGADSHPSGLRLIRKNTCLSCFIAGKTMSTGKKDVLFAQGIKYWLFFTHKTVSKGITGLAHRASS